MAESVTATTDFVRRREAVGQRRLFDLASRGEVLDDNLYTTPGKFGGRRRHHLAGRVRRGRRQIPAQIRRPGITQFVLSDTRISARSNARAPSCSLCCATDGRVGPVRTRQPRRRVHSCHGLGLAAAGTASGGRHGGGRVRGRWRPTTGASLSGEPLSGTPYLRRFWGSPFAEPPVGELRFAAPSRKRRGTVFSMRPDSAPPAARRPVSHSSRSRACRVRAPSTSMSSPLPRQQVPGLPVMVWIHGGGYSAGSPASPGTTAATSTETAWSR